MSTVYNTTYIATTPPPGSYEHVVSGLTTENPGDPASRMGGHDYALHVICDLNGILANFQIHRNLATNTMSTRGEVEAWRQLHGVLNAGEAPNGSTVVSFRTIYPDGDETSIQSWVGLFAGAISTAFNPLDLNGLSVQIPVLQAKLDDRIGGPSTNDIIGVLNSAFSQSLGGGDGTEISLEVAPNPSFHFLSAVALFLYSLRGASATGDEGSLTGDPSTGFVSLALKPGDGIGMRMLVHAVGTVSMLILLEQS